MAPIIIGKRDQLRTQNRTTRRRTHDNNFTDCSLPWEFDELIQVEGNRNCQRHTQHENWYWTWILVIIVLHGIIQHWTQSLVNWNCTVTFYSPWPNYYWSK